MAKIREYFSSIDKLTPVDTGYQAWEMAGRRIGPLYSQAANDMKESAKLAAQPGDLAAKNISAYDRELEKLQNTKGARGGRVDSGGSDRKQPVERPAAAARLTGTAADEVGRGLLKNALDDPANYDKDGHYIHKAGQLVEPSGQNWETSEGSNGKHYYRELPGEQGSDYSGSNNTNWAGPDATPDVAEYWRLYNGLGGNPVPGSYNAVPNVAAAGPETWGQTFGNVGATIAEGADYAYQHGKGLLSSLFGTDTQPGAGAPVARPSNASADSDTPSMWATAPVGPSAPAANTPTETNPSPTTEDTTQ